MKRNYTTISVKKVKRAYKQPKLIKYGHVSQLTLKGGSASDTMSSVNDFQA
ncbi:hypothetical protein [Spirosoma arboris]|uniref:hypothetical protein n=1 Tax=Spirosoma arboris TaxID=2682092 RepID=UPI0018DE8E4F|nr:hypothetical protein [Spirosoma arboris]